MTALKILSGVFSTLAIAIIFESSYFNLNVYLEIIHSIVWFCMAEFSILVDTEFPAMVGRFCNLIHECNFTWSICCCFSQYV